ncbi:Transcription factor GTE10 isoform B [Glycine soja]|uniref:Transcription factor GTE10 isoform B n=1 Tax=Glycine soja TaxID=3848 RepID=A0A445L2I6_GLYSO|nr:Transcription factor GTE10 isoform B [Glycine soja]
MAPTVPIEFAGQKESRKYSHSQNMGKSRKYSKGYATGFVPDFRHAVETMGESEGLGSLGRVDTELTALADSCAPKGKRPGLNAGDGGYGSFDVPFQHFSLSAMSGFERKDLKVRLTWELEQVREFRKKIDGMNSNVVGLSLSSDIMSCSAGQKRPKLESQHRTMEVSVPHGKKRPLPGHTGPKLKKSMSGHLEYAKPAAPVTSYATLMKLCENVLNRLMSHQFGWVFNTPVDVVKLNIPDYFTVIKHPMDLGTVKKRITSGEYSNPMDFAADVRLTFENAMFYNPAGNDVHIMAETLSKFFETRWKAIEKKIPAIDSVASEPSRPTHVETEISDRVPPTKKKKITPNDTNVKPEPVKRIMTVEEKQKLSLELETMIGELPDSISDFLREQSYNEGQINDDEIEIDIDALSDDTLFKLRKLLDDYMLEKQKSLAKAGQCEMELLNESGFSNSSMQPHKDAGEEQVEEDVDIIGGNDPPISNYPPLEIEKDVTNRNSKCSSLSSSSSESGSSSSGSYSDSGSSSGSELDMAKTSEPLSATKENVGFDLTSDQNKGDPGNSETGKDSTNVGGQVEQSSQSGHVATEPESHQDGESAASKRQVSPEKLYRAALLRSRFADTILKAQEKALEKDEKRDPEKLRIEREDLERRQKEEKARLQAEAKAAEEAQRKAEAEAAAEAKRKRELEREAARQALQKMEKTVDINENSHFLEDLEMLSAVHDEHLPSFKEETSADQPQDGLGGIKLQGNPLEQLGLYMKEEEEEEEEEEPPLSGAAGPSNDVEEGEID